MDNLFPIKGKELCDSTKNFQWILVFCTEFILSSHNIFVLKASIIQPYTDIPLWSIKAGLVSIQIGPGIDCCGDDYA